MSITAATQPSVEDVLLGAIPGLPKVHLHNPVLAYEVGDDFMKYWYLADEGKLEPFALVVEGSIPKRSGKRSGDSSPGYSSNRARRASDHMPDLNFRIDGVEVPSFAATPLLAFQLGITSVGEQYPIHSVVLRCQVQIAATRRRYNPQEQEQLLDLFGEPDRWSQTLRSLLWTHASVVVPSFDGSTVVDLNVPCTYDFNVAATKYFYALEDGEVPLLFLFSGTIFYAADAGALQITQIAWNKEAPFRLPISVWQEMMDRYYPNNAWLPLRKDVFDQLYQYKRRHGLPTWEQALEHLLAATERKLR